ncbi:hypothetical protein [Spirosoma areae]
MNTLSKCLCALLIGTAFMLSCSRPVAYFQPSAREHFAASTATTAPAPVAEISALVAETPAPASVNSSVGQLPEATVALNQLDALVHSDSKVVAHKTVQKRLNRVRNLLTAASAKTERSPTEISTPKKMNLLERLMVKKMNKQINRQLAPANPEKTMISTGTLATGAVLVILGLLLLLLTTGTGATVGLIALLAGAVVLLVGLL